MLAGDTLRAPLPPVLVMLGLAILLRRLTTPHPGVSADTRQHRCHPPRPARFDGSPAPSGRATRITPRIPPHAAQQETPCASRSSAPATRCSPARSSTAISATWARSSRMSACRCLGYHRRRRPREPAAAFRLAGERADAVIVNGGLGPTVDDLSQEIAAQAAGVELVLNEEWLATMEEFFPAAAAPCRQQPQAGDAAGGRRDARQPDRHRLRLRARYRQGALLLHPRRAA